MPTNINIKRQKAQEEIDNINAHLDVFQNDWGTLSTGEKTDAINAAIIDILINQRRIIKFLEREILGRDGVNLT